MRCVDPSAFAAAASVAHGGYFSGSPNDWIRGLLGCEPWAKLSSPPMLSGLVPVNWQRVEPITCCVTSGCIVMRPWATLISGFLR